MSVETISKQLMAAMHCADQDSPAFIQTMELKCPFLEEHSSSSYTCTLGCVLNP